MPIAWARKISLALALYTPTVLSYKQQFFKQSFFFNWDEGLPVPIPVTRQCDVLHIKWSRDRADGPNPIAPYTLQIYTSTFVVPFIVDAGSNLNFDWAVPFVPGTQYQICMFDKNGNSGGCEAVYTVIDPASSPVSCTNITFPGVLEVEGTVWDGPLSQYGWVDSCTDIKVNPKNGSPPYTFTAAPALHPPWNITVDAMEAINWTVALSWASPFFISLIDSAGNAWSHGPLHSGGRGSTSCLNIDDNEKSIHGVSTAIMAGSIAAALIVGLLSGATFYYFFSKHHTKRGPRYSGITKHVSPTEDSFNLDRASAPNREASYNSAHSHDSSTLLLSRLGRSEYAVEPFVLPPQQTPISTTTSIHQDSSSQIDNTGPLSPTSTRDPHHQPSNLQPTTHNTHNQEPSSPSGDRPGQSVYVVHHDAGRAPVTVYTADGTEVVELPPRYIGFDRSRRPRQPPDQSDRRFYTTNGMAESEAEGPSNSPINQTRIPGPTSKP